MPLRRKSKVSAQFNMSSLTDIIFLLLIFFMLTSTIVAPNALNLKLPGKTQRASTNTEKLSDVRVRSTGAYAWNGSAISKDKLDDRLRGLSRKSQSQRSFTISPDKKAPVEDVIYVMDLAMRYNLDAGLMPEK